MNLRLATPSDIPAIIDLERLPQLRPFIGQWSEERHLATLASSDARYYVAEGEAGELDAYVILRGLAEPNNAVELKRIAVRTPERGTGSRVLEQLLHIVFGEMHAHRLWLDVFEWNARARRVYEKFGFAYEGTLREAIFTNGQYHTLRLMALLEQDYRARVACSDRR
jgi:diamine N-acetyltransferase